MICIWAFVSLVDARSNWIFGYVISLILVAKHALVSEMLVFHLVVRSRWHALLWVKGPYRENA